MEESNRDLDTENNISGDQAKVDDIKTKELPPAEPSNSMDIDITTKCEQATDPADTNIAPSEASTSGADNPPDEPSTPAAAPEMMDIKIIYNKKKYDHSIDINKTVRQLKDDIENLTGVPVATQKVMFKGSTQDSQTLKELKVTKSANKFMVIGSTMTDLLKVSAPDPKTLQEDSSGKAAASSKEPLCKQTAHKKVLDKHGKPEDVGIGLLGSVMSLPNEPLSGMYNKYGHKTRLTFKLGQDEVWIGTKERTQKIKMGSIKDVVSQPIEGHEGYHIMGIQLGTTELSKYWIYWVPCQYVDAIKDTILGKWGEF